MTRLPWRDLCLKAPFSKCFPLTLKRKASDFSFLRFEEHFRKALFWWWISVDGRLKAGIREFKWHFTRFKKGLKGKKRLGKPPESWTPPKGNPWLVGNCLVYVYQFLTSKSFLKQHQVFEISYFHKFHLSFEKYASIIIRENPDAFGVFGCPHLCWARKITNYVFLKWTNNWNE